MGLVWDPAGEALDCRCMWQHLVHGQPHVVELRPKHLEGEAGSCLVFADLVKGLCNVRMYPLSGSHRSLRAKGT